MPAHKLSWEEADRWIRELGTTWEDVLKAAKVGTAAPTLKMRWTRGSTGDTKTGGPAPQNREKVRDALEALERKKPTKFGQALMTLERWMDLGAKIAQMPDNFMIVTRHLERVAAAVENAGTAQSTVEVAHEAIDEAMAPLRAAVPLETRDEHEDRPAAKHSTLREGARKPTVTR